MAWTIVATAAAAGLAAALATAAACSLRRRESRLDALKNALLGLAVRKTGVSPRFDSDAAVAEFLAAFVRLVEPPDTMSAAGTSVDDDYSGVSDGEYDSDGGGPGA